MMKFALFVLFFFSVPDSVFSQDSIPPLDRSPMDMSYFPFNYPVLKVQHKATDPLIMRVNYGRPQRNNRTIFGDLVPYNSVWRLGANEATEIEFFRDVKINGKKLMKGRYTIYAIPDSARWTMILNTETDTWGAFGYDQKKDVLREGIPLRKRKDSIDMFTLYFEGTQKNRANLVMIWDNIEARLPISWQ